ncbi:hypothetical protein SY88_03835 [Clostridiales bacterium PH28_bin88]|nr:hypothetical protein SY88_03835 [Clostridiales bacterium PH28_bin88]
MRTVTIGVAGTAKNTGKTTTTASLMEGLLARGIRLGLTSIGYDGEKVDNVTGLPKPRLHLRAGDLVATAEKCLQAGSAAIRVWETTDIMSPLGKVVLGEVTRDGLVVIAGPNKSNQLRRVVRQLQEAGSLVTIVDGALNRMAPMIETDGFILATGASRQPNIELLTNETTGLCMLSRRLQVELNVPEECAGVIAAMDRNGEWTPLLPGNSLLDADSVHKLQEKISDSVLFIWVPGVIAQVCWEELERGSLPSGVTLVMADPIKLLVAGDPDKVFKHLQRIEKRGVVVAVRKNLPLLAVTVNPFFPRYRYDVADYEPAYVDANALVEKMREALEVPVFDVVRQGCGLMELVLTWAGFKK